MKKADATIMLSTPQSNQICLLPQQCTCVRNDVGHVGIVWNLQDFGPVSSALVLCRKHAGRGQADRRAMQGGQHKPPSSAMLLAQVDVGLH